MKALLRIVQLIYCVYALIMFCLIMFFVLPFVFLSLLFGKIQGGNFIYRICTFWAFTWYFFVGIRHKEIYEAPLHKKKQYIFIANHISYMDIPALVRSIRQPIRALGKKEMIHWPVFGWIYRTAAILVDRSSAEKRAKSVRALTAAIDQGISIFLFPEGTFNETGKPLKSFFDGAFRIAIETQTPILPMIFPDTIKRMHYRGFFELTPGVCRTIFLKEIPVEGLNLKDLPALKALAYSNMEKALLKYH
ncbi:MAG: 1-acyl-sn-glycerol-3-phosphate acyltransferase [Bacteroidetes bacterium]|nr:1-acyl-sn-glycerol-3-phosphate acyltransferase [Bacteroidota bacterium]